MPAVMTPQATPIDQQRQQVEAVLQSHAIGGYLRAALGMRRDVRDECRILDVKYEPGAYCTILYQLDGRRVIGVLRWGDGADELPETAEEIAPLGMRVYPFEHDPALPGLALALDPQRAARALAEALPELRDPARLLRCRVAPLRYRPGKRCTMRYDLWVRDSRTGALAARALFGKVYHDLAKATAVYQEMQMLSAAAPARDGRLVVARAAAFLPGVPMVLQEPVEGNPLDAMLEWTASGSHGWSGTLRAASALAALHTAGLSTDRERPIESELKRFKRRIAQVAAIDEPLAKAMQELFAVLERTLAQHRAWGAEISLIHGDCKPSQFLIGPAAVALLDFDHCGMADPASDVGNFTASLRQLATQRAQKNRSGHTVEARRDGWLADLERQFLDTYCATSNREPAFRTRTAWYAGAALLRKALRSFARSPRSPLPAALVAAAWRDLDEWR